MPLLLVSNETQSKISIRITKYNVQINAKVMKSIDPRNIFSSKKLSQ